jgi:hypothetical protein
MTKLLSILCRKREAEKFNAYRVIGMKRTLRTVSMLLLLSILATSTIVLNAKTANATRASLQRGTRYDMSQSEQDASYGACVAIRAYFYDTGQYNYLGNYYGSDTQQATTLGNVSQCENYYDYATVFYKGHCCYVNDSDHWHYYLYDNDGGGATDRIWDFGVGYRTANGMHNFVFLWACGTVGNGTNVGGIDGTHTWFFPASWLHTTSLASNGYTETSDNGANCFIGFKNYSKPFIESTGYGGWSYRYWCTYFYLYALDDGLSYSVKEALDAASQTTIGEDLDETELYQGYDIYQFGTYWHSKIWVYGNGDIELPK